MKTDKGHIFLLLVYLAYIDVFWQILDTDSETLKLLDTDSDSENLCIKPTYAYFRPNTIQLQPFKALNVYIQAFF